MRWHTSDLSLCVCSIYDTAAGKATAPPPSAFADASTALARSDVVEEYNKAVELWYSCTKPSFAALHAMLSKVKHPGRTLAHLFA